MELEEQIARFAMLRGYPPRIILQLPKVLSHSEATLCAPGYEGFESSPFLSTARDPIGEGEARENWKRYALLVSKQEGYSYTLVQQTTDGYLLLRTCEQDFFHQFPGTEWLRPRGWYLGSTHLGWTHNQLRWFFMWWRMGAPPTEITL
jgi:hypothetical protein